MYNFITKVMYEPSLEMYIKITLAKIKLHSAVVKYSFGLTFRVQGEEREVKVELKQKS